MHEFLKVHRNIEYLWSLNRISKTVKCKTNEIIYLGTEKVMFLKYRYMNKMTNFSIPLQELKVRIYSPWLLSVVKLLSVET